MGGVGGGWVVEGSESTRPVDHGQERIASRWRPGRCFRASGSRAAPRRCRKLRRAAARIDRGLEGLPALRVLRAALYG